MALKFAVPIILVLCVHGHKGFVGDLQSVGCKLPDEVENGEIIYPVITRMKNQIGSIAFLLCNPPFVLEGNAIAACCSDGEWRPSLGICKNATYCLPYVYKDAVSLHYNSTLKEMPLNTTVALECAYGQHVLGSAESKCVEGTWRPKLGICVDNVR
uniref:Sushi domain-containing protein n=1 Tax=Onchocerca volvulus TaxID=6282 RepID=A0A8R1XWP6_ONCVO